MTTIIRLLAALAEAFSSFVKFKTSPKEQARIDDKESNEARTAVADAVQKHDTDAVNRATQEALKLVLISFLLFSGCIRTTVPPAPVYVQAEEKVTPIEKGQAVLSPFRGYLVPDAIYGALLDRIMELKAENKRLKGQ